MSVIRIRCPADSILPGTGGTDEALGSALESPGISPGKSPAHDYTDNGYRKLKPPFLGIPFLIFWIHFHMYDPPLSGLLGILVGSY